MLIMLLCSFLFVVQNAVAEKDPAEEIKVFCFLSELGLIVIFIARETEKLNS